MSLLTELENGQLDSIAHHKNTNKSRRKRHLDEERVESKRLKNVSAAEETTIDVSMQDKPEDDDQPDSQNDSQNESNSRSRRAITQPKTTTIVYKNRAGLFKVNYANTIIEYKLSSILKTLCNITLTTSSNAFKSFNLGPTPINLPFATDLKELFAADIFAANFSACWPGEEIKNITTTYQSTKINSVQVRIQNDLAPSPKQSQLNSISAGTFRTLFCLFMSYYYGVSLHMCLCYPQNTAERLMLDQGLGKNCYSAACRSYLENNMHTFDPLVNSRCDSINQTAIVLLNNFILNSDASINIVQTINSALVKKN